MREIKFRAWDQRMNRMVEWRYISDLISGERVCVPFQDTDVLLEIGGISKDVPFAHYTGNPFEIFKATLMQYTGLKDKKGVEIYDEDYFKAFGHIYKISFVEKLACFQMFNQNKEMPNDSGFIMNMNGEVIGNIYENPELLDLE